MLLRLAVLYALLAVDLVAGSWTTGPTMPDPVGYPAMGLIGTRVYVVGGIDASQHRGNTLQIFDLTTQTWSTGDPAPHDRVCGGYGVFGTKFYVVGGHDDSGSPVFAMDIYDTKAATWTQGTSLPVSIDCGASAVLGQKLYLFGGDNRQPSDDGLLYIYDLVQNTWTEGPQMPTAREGPTASVTEGKIFVIGGYTTGEVQSNVVEAYDPVANTWNVEPPLLVARAYAASSILAGSLYVIGGEINSGPGVASVEAFSPLTNTWAEATPLPTGYYGHSVVSGSTIYFVGFVENSFSFLEFSVSAGNTCGAFDVSKSVTIVQEPFLPGDDLGNYWTQIVTLSNSKATAIPGPIYMVLDGLPRISTLCPYGCNVLSGAVTTCNSSSPLGSAVVEVLPNGMSPSQTTQAMLYFVPGPNTAGSPNVKFSYTARFFSGFPLP